MRNATSKTVRTKTAIIDKDFAGPAKRTRLPQESEAYSKLFYDTKLRPIVEQKMLEDVPDHETALEKNSRLLRIIKQVTHEGLQNETPENKDAVQRYIAEAKEKKQQLQETTEADSNTGTTVELTPEELQWSVAFLQCKLVANVSLQQY
jgi:hypothetical protein